MHGKFDGLGRFADPSLLILTSLSDGPKHGYAMMTDIAAFSGVRMEPGALDGRLSRAVVGCYPRRWKQRYAAELLDVLDQHRAGPRTVLSLAGGALSTHLDPDYRMQIRLKPHLSR